MESFEFFDYRPPVSENFNDIGSEFSITAYNEDIVTQPSKSLIVLNGSLKVSKSTTTGTPPTLVTTNVSPLDLSKINFVNNGILHLFDRIDYYIGDVKVDTIRKPGISTLVKGLVSFENDLRFNNAGWKINTADAANNVLNEKGYFSFTIPLSIVMGVFEDYKKFIYRMPQKLIFYRNTGTPSNVVYTTYPADTTGTYEVTITLKDIVWRVPQVKFDIAHETQVRKEILNNTNYELLYRHWFYQSVSPPVGTDYTWDFPVAYSKTKYILLGFQNDRDNKLDNNNAYFDFVNLENVQVLLNNNVYYPRERLNLKIDELKCGNLYHMFKQFKVTYYDKKTDEVDPLVDYNTFLKNYPITVIDCSHQPNVIKESLINIKIMFNWREVTTAKLIIHCVMILDRKAVYNPLNNRVIGQ